jgi:hypothetical protein
MHAAAAAAAAVIAAIVAIVGMSLWKKKVQSLHR